MITPIATFKTILNERFLLPREIEEETSPTVATVWSEPVAPVSTRPNAERTKAAIFAWVVLHPKSSLPNIAKGVNKSVDYTGELMRLLITEGLVKKLSYHSTKHRDYTRWVYQRKENETATTCLDSTSPR